MRTENIKDKVLSLLNGMMSDSKIESYKCEKELVKIINSANILDECGGLVWIIIYIIRL